MVIVKRLNVPLVAAACVALASGVAGIGVVLVLPHVGDLILPLALGLLFVPGILGLCWFKFDLMLFIALASSSVVFVEPAPVDFLMIVLLVVGLLNGQLSLRRLRGATLVHVASWMLLLTNLFALIQPFTAPASLVFAAVSIYLLASMYLFKMYVVSPNRGLVVLSGYWVAVVIAVGGVLLAYLGVGAVHSALVGLRARGFFKDPNVFGPFLVPLFVLLLDELIDPVWPRVPALVKGLSLIPIVVGVLLSFSRAAWANLFIVVAVYGVLNLLKQRRVKQLLLVFAVAGLATSLLVGALFVMRPDLVDMLNWRLTLVQQYDAFRFTRHQQGILTAFIAPTGLGPGTFGGAHQLYIKMLAEQGLMGFLALLTLLLTLAFKVWEAALRSDKVLGLSTAALVAGLVGTLANGFLIDMVHWRHFYLLLGLCWAVSSGIEGGRRGAGSTSSRWEENDGRDN
jgi:hypothetical protein